MFCLILKSLDRPRILRPSEDVGDTMPLSAAGSAAASTVGSANASAAKMFAKLHS